MASLNKKRLKYFLKDLDQNVFGGFFFKLRKDHKKPVPELVITPEEREIALKEVIRQVQRPLPGDRDIKRVEILVLNFKAPEVEVKCAQHLIENTNWPYKLNLFDNRPGTKNMSKIFNKVIKESTCDYIVIMDSDVFVPKLDPCWLTRCMETFTTHPDCIAVVPLVTKTSTKQLRASEPRKNPPEKIKGIFANMCVLYKKEGFEKIGYFDEEFLMYAPDSEWSHRLINSLYSAYVRPDVLVDHIGHYSNTKESKIKGQEILSVVEKEYSEDTFKKKTGTDL